MRKFLPNETDENFLIHCYRYFFSREPDPRGEKYYLEEMSNGMEREILIQELISSDEFINKFNSGNLYSLTNSVSPFQRFASEGHFYSPIPAGNDYKVNYDSLVLDEIDDKLMNEEYQLKIAEKFRAFYDELPFMNKTSSTHRYYLDNGSFNYFDGIILYSFIRMLNPKNIIEIGSGFSSALMIDTCEKFLNGKTDISFIDPYPSRLYNCIRPEDKKRYKFYEKNVQDVQLDIYQSLGENDILFVDSSHDSKFGSDVNYILFKIIPILQNGVIIHFHDIFKNFDYPVEWLKEGRAWNESYILRAFLSCNKDYKILFFNDWFADRHWTYLEKHMPLCTVQPKGSPFKNCGVSLWIKKVKQAAAPVR